MCGGFLLSEDKHTAGKKNFHKNCWSRLDRKQQKLIQDENILNFTIKNFKKEYNMKVIELFHLLKSKLRHSGSYAIICCCKCETDKKNNKYYNIKSYDEGVIILEEIKE